LVLAVATLLASQAQAAPKYRVELLPPLADRWASFDAADMNNLGEVLARGGGWPLIFSQGSYHRIDALDPSRIGGVKLRFLNNQGDVALTIGSRPNDRPYLLKDGQLIDITPAGQTDRQSGPTDVTGLTQSGQVVGHYRSRMFFYDGVQSHYLDLGLREDQEVYTAGMNEAGVILGSIVDADYNRTTFIYDHGQLTDIGRILPRAINNANQVLGGMNSGSIGVSRTVIRDSDGSLRRLDGFFGSDLNDKGWVAGYRFASTGGYDAHLYRGGRVHKLDDLVIDKPQGLWLYNATEINNAGQVFGRGWKADVGWVSYIASPVPELQSQALLLCGLGVVGAVTWQRRRGHGRRDIQPSLA
jgi:hypothetical protein